MGRVPSRARPRSKPPRRPEALGPRGWEPRTAEGGGGAPGAGPGRRLSPEEVARTGPGRAQQRASLKALGRAREARCGRADFGAGGVLLQQVLVGPGSGVPGTPGQRVACPACHEGKEGLACQLLGRDGDSGCGPHAARAEQRSTWRAWAWLWVGGWSFGGDPGGAGSRAAWLLGLKATVAILTSSEGRQVSGSMSSLLSEPERGCVASAPRQEDGDLGIQMKAGVLLLYPLNCPWPPFPGRVLIYSTRRVKTSAHPGSGWMEA